ncbi:MAG TPA: SusE domain-containing protein [Cyclobacteriaceae bacterium]|nr:SusE domain-containing protein [Cyclobacteriaceae bacterium]
MKKLKILYLLALLVSIFFSCEDDGPKATLKSDVAPNELKAPSSDSYVLTLEDKDATMETFEWTAPDYGFPAGAIYSLQVDVAGNDFANAVEVASTNTLEAAVNVGAFNDILLGLGLTPEEAASVEFRVVSTINSHVAPVYSNPRTIEVSAYATTFPPIYGMGAALKGWGPWPDNAVEWQSSEYKKYETTAYFTNGETFRWFAQLDWGPTSYNYPFFTTVDPTFVNANDGDSNLRVDGPSGWYEVSVDLGAKTVAAVAVEEPVLYMMGAALNGWGPWPGAAVKMTYIKPGVFEADATFSNETFRFFAQADWGPTSYNYPYFSSVDANFENANDGDSNLRYIGTPGSQKVTVDLNNKTVTLGEPPVPVLYMMGAALNGWGPWPDAAVSMTYKSPGVFEATATFTNGEAFRFFEQADWGPTSYNYPYFTTVDTDFENAGDGDSNLKYVGATGSRTVTVNLATKVVTLD